MEIVETMLPGVGIRYELTTSRGRSVALIVHRDGGATVCSYAGEDPDEASETIRLQPDEAATLAELMGAPRLSQRFADLSKEVPGLESARLELRPGTPCDGRVLGDTRARTRTGCSVVAIVRGEQVLTSPGPGEVLHAGDVLVAIGTDEGLRRLEGLLAEPGLGD